MAVNKPSTIDRLPGEVREQIAKLRRDGRTLDEIMDHLHQLDVDVSRSALGRHVKSMAEVGEQLRRSETMAKFIVEKFGDEPDERIGRANMRILQGAVLELLTADRKDDDGQPIGLSVDEAKELALTLQRLITAQKADAERALKIEADTRRKVAADVEKVGRKLGWSADTARTVRAEIFGVDVAKVAASVKTTAPGAP